MARLKDNLVVKEEELKLTLAQSEFAADNFLRTFPRQKKIILIILVAALVPTVVVVRIGTQLVTQKKLAATSVGAHPSYSAALPPSVGAVTLINSGRGWYSAYVQVTNDNLDLAASNIPYKFDFYNTSNELVTASSGSLYLLPNQKKYLVVPRLDTKEQLVKGQLTFGDFQWQKRITIPQVSLRAATPFVSNELNPLTLVAEGAVVNDSPYELAAVRLVFVLYDKSNKIVAVSQRDEFNLPAFGRRAYKQTWPDLYQADISKVLVFPDTNTMDSNNLISSNG